MQAPPNEMKIGGKWADTAQAHTHTRTEVHTYRQGMAEDDVFKLWILLI